MSWAKIIAAAGLCALGLLFTLASCGSDDGPRPTGPRDTEVLPARDGSVQVEPPADADVVCGSDASRDCVIDRGVFNGIHDCAKGSQLCENGRWGKCLEY
jgi:hypothetical protein